MAEHISRKELKQDKIHDAIEHGAEAVFSHSTILAIAILAAVIVAVGYAGWRFYTDRKTVQASASLDVAMRTYSARVGTVPDPTDPGEILYPTEEARAEDAAQKFSAVAEKYP
ncbi:MAG: hypothetical protein WBE73_11995, partial [Candidatus Acidiferrum sp.]